LYKSHDAAVFAGVIIVVAIEKEHPGWDEIRLGVVCVELYQGPIIPGPPVLVVWVSPEMVIPTFQFRETIQLVNIITNCLVPVLAEP
jgi:hypothetical protein